MDYVSGQFALSLAVLSIWNIASEVRESLPGPGYRFCLAGKKRTFELGIKIKWQYIWKLSVRRKYVH